MSSTERIPVPTNGHHTLADATADAPSPVDSVVPADAPDDEDAPRIVVTPGQATVVGFGIIAGLILLALGRRRGRKG
jgi:hypothetical protein